MFNRKSDQFSLLDSYFYFLIRLEVSSSSSGVELKNVAKVKDADKVFDEMTRRFLSFKKQKFFFVRKWVVNAKAAKLRTKAAAEHLSFDQQCKHCEKSRSTVR
ncbi:uncharacterized protein LOC111492242 [Cucurbita maxima]|uniref:Uncharacterized protein LOC111492242 n=1 Tax=Cucurbita maxima TaxID=3661 RepID=A0A6J1K742_CUCMA|nr:uncharacterized protein LOC111492242 [Cucurbita maxima]